MNLNVNQIKVRFMLIYTKINKKCAFECIKKNCNLMRPWEKIEENACQYRCVIGEREKGSQRCMNSFG